MNSRPLGITILAVYFAISGVSVVVLQFFFSPELKSALANSSAAPVTSMIFLLLVALLGISAGVTMWLGKGIGWWLGISHLVLSAIRNSWAAFLLAQVAESTQGPVELMPRLYLKHGFRVALSLGLIYYFFRPQVLAYFKRGKVSASA